MIFGYARVSAKDQNLDTQYQLLKQAGADQIFEEKISGATTSRPLLDFMMEGLRAGDTVMVARLDRLGRDSKHVIQVVADITDKDARFVALDLGVDTRTPTGKMILTVFAALAEYDRASRKDRTDHGRKLAAERGQHMGRRPGRNEEAKKKVADCLSAGFSLNKTADITGVSLSSVKRYKAEIEQAKAQQKSPS